MYWPAEQFSLVQTTRTASYSWSLLMRPKSSVLFLKHSPAGTQHRNGCILLSVEQDVIVSVLSRRGAMSRSGCWYIWKLQELFRARKIPEKKCFNKVFYVFCADFLIRRFWLHFSCERTMQFILLPTFISLPWAWIKRSSFEFIRFSASSRHFIHAQDSRFVIILGLLILAKQKIKNSRLFKYTSTLFYLLFHRETSKTNERGNFESLLSFCTSYFTRDFWCS